MPIEIKELHIKGTVNGGKETGGESNNSAADQTGISEKDMKLIIQQCVEQVLEVLKEKAER